jgi:FkbM family methyltransferase
MLTRKIKNYIRDRTWRFLKAKWKLRSGIITRVENDSDWFVFNEIFSNKEYDPAIHLFLPRASSRPLILDLGANVGYFSLCVADALLEAGFKDYNIIAVEASPSNFRVLQRRLDQSQLKGKIQSFLGLAGHKSGTGIVEYSTQHYGHSTAGAKSGKHAVQVEYLNIENLITDASQKIDLLKCDIEGSEEIFIKTYKDLLERVNNAVFEFHAGECNIDNCHSMLRNVGLFSRGVIKEDMSYQTTVEIFSRG